MARPPSQPFASDLAGEPEELLALVHDRHDRHRLRGYLGYLSHHRTAPRDAADADLDGYIDELARRNVKRLTQVHRDVALTWNRHSAANPKWPRNQLTVKDSLRRRSLPYDAFPASFKIDAEAYLDQQPARDELFDESTHNGFAAATRTDRGHKIRQLATIALDCGVPAYSLRSLSDLVDESTRILEHLWKSNDRNANGHAANLARVVKSIAKNYVRAPAAVIEKISRAQRKMRPRRSGMTEGNRAKLRVLTEEQNLRQILQLSQKVLASVNAAHPTIAEAVRLQSALGVATVLSTPMRAKNLANLSDHHLDRVGARDCYVVVPGAEVKNGRPLHYKLSASVIAVLDVYRAQYRPLLVKDKTSTALFVSRNGKQKTPAQLSAQISTFIAQQTKLRMNVHLFRHLAGYIFLTEHPGQYEPVRQLLGHKSIKTTIEFYTGLEEAETFARYDAILDRRGRSEGIDAGP